MLCMFQSFLILIITGLSLSIDPDIISDHENFGLLPFEECGLNSADRIIGGETAALGQYPWLARLGYYNYCRNKVTFNCGGALITNKFILTASHCAVNLPMASCNEETHRLVLSTVRLGENDSDTDEDCDGDLCADPVQDIGVKEIISNKKYGIPKFGNDIALLKLKRRAKFNGWVMPLCLPTGKQLNKNYVGKVAEVAGWGTVNVTAKLDSKNLLYVKMKVVDVDYCNDKYNDKYHLNKLFQMCAGGKKNKDSCTGDSGGPLVIPEAIDGPPKYYAVGIVSFGSKSCGTVGKPGVYTRVAGYMEWILDNLEP